MWRINFCWICQHDPFSSCWPCPSQCLLAYELNATFAVPLIRAPSVFLTAAACVNLGLQPIKQMLPVLLPFPPFMSSCPFLLFFSPGLMLQSPGPLSPVWSSQLPGSCSPASTLFGLELGEAVSTARNSLGHQAGAGSW